MSKIGLLTFHDTNNFGSWLQTYALYKKVKDMGEDIEIIDYQCEGIKLREKIPFQKMTNMPLDNVLIYLERQLAFKKYSKQRLKKSTRKYTKANIRDSIKEYKLFLLGSDLVWDLNITYSDTTYLFDFLDEGIERCAYAASSGRDRIPQKQRALFEEYLKKFNDITVREDTMVYDIESLTEKKAYHVCDPTMLLEAKEWETFIKRKRITKKYVLVYFVDGKGKVSHFAKKYAKENGYEVLAINKDFNIKKENIIKPISICDFLSYIYYAEKIFTASYHGMVFSLIFNKQFAFFPFAPSTRMLSLSRTMGVEKQNVELRTYNNNEFVDYEIVNEKIMRFRKESIERLQDMIRKQNE